MRIILEESQPGWPRQFDEEVKRIRGLIGPMIARLEHIGSTAIPGLAAKPVIDVQVGVHDLQAFDAASGIRLLTDGGYQHFAHYEAAIPFRRFFVREEGDTRLANIHLVAVDHPWFRRHITLRDYLRASPDARRRYQFVKQELARCDWPTTNDYAAAKTDIVLTLEEEAFRHFSLLDTERELLRSSRV